MSCARLYNATKQYCCYLEYKPHLDHLAALGALEINGKIQVAQGQVIKEPRLWLFCYGD